MPGSPEQGLAPNTDHPGEGRSRWPHWVYRDGSEPDYRVSLANERTFLAWIRTALAPLAAGVALQGLELGLEDPLRSVLAAVLVLLGTFCAAVAWLRWASSERAIRRRVELPPLAMGAALAAGIALVGVATLAALLTS